MWLNFREVLAEATDTAKARALVPEWLVADFKARRERDARIRLDFSEIRFSPFAGGCGRLLF